MTPTRFTDERIIHCPEGDRAAINERANPGRTEAGAKCADLCRKHGMSEGPIYNWKAKFGGMTVPEAKRLKTLEDEKAEQMKGLAAMKDLVSRKW